MHLDDQSQVPPKMLTWRVLLSLGRNERTDTVHSLEKFQFVASLVLQRDILYAVSQRASGTACQSVLGNSFCISANSVLALRIGGAACHYEFPVMTTSGPCWHILE